MRTAQLRQCFRTAEAIDRWFEDLQHYEATLEEMAAASLDQVRRYNATGVAELILTGGFHTELQGGVERY